MTSKTATKYHPKNERIKRDYFQFLADVDQKADSTIDGVRKAILRYESYARYKDFKTLHREQIVAFKRQLEKQTNERTGRPLSKGTILTTLNALKDFFRWLSMHPNYKKDINPADIGYFNMKAKDVRIAKTTVIKPIPSLRHIEKALNAMPAHTLIEQRDRALVGFTLATAARVNALATLKIKHVDLEQGLVTQDPRDVETKFSKLIYSYFMPLPVRVHGQDLPSLISDWIYKLFSIGFTHDDPLFPKTLISQDKNQLFQKDGVKPEHWQQTQAIRDVFRMAFARVGLPYYNPHSFRKTIIHYLQDTDLTPKEYKAISQNLGHEDVLTTFKSYGELDVYEQGKTIRGLA